MTINEDDQVRTAPNSWLARLKLSPLVWRVRRRWLRNRDVTVAEGVAAGLKFNAAASNPEYSIGSNERPVQEAFVRFLHAGDVFYDVGANVGFFTVIGAKLVGPTGQVHAFEPVPANATAVRHNCELNGLKQVKVWETAVSDKPGTGQLQLAEFSGGASLSVAAPPPDYAGMVDVSLITLDEIVQTRQAPPPDLVKIDVEGAEIQVLRGMVGIIEKHKPIVIFEIDDGSREAFAEKKAICTDFLQNLGYSIEMLPDSYPHAGWIVENFVALPK